MATVTICSDFGAWENKVCHCFCFLPIDLPWSDGMTCHDLSFWMLNFKPTFSLSSFIFIKRLFSSSSVSVYLRLLVFLPVFLIPACASSRPDFTWKCNRDEQISLYIGFVSFTVTFVFCCFCYKLNEGFLHQNIFSNELNPLSF